MEKTEESKEPSFSDELATIYQLISDYRKEINNEVVSESEKKSKKRALIVTAAILATLGIMILALYFLPHSTWGDTTEGIRLTLQIIVLSGYVLGGIAILFQYISLKGFYQNFTSQVIGFASESAKDEAAVFEELDGLSTESIKYVANRLENSSTQLNQIRSFLLGAIEKVGIIPGLLATVIAISSLADKTGFAWVEILSVFMFGIYLSMFPITEAALKIKRVSVLLEQYLVLFRSN